MQTELSSELNITDIDNVNDLPADLHKFIEPVYKIDVYDNCCIYRELIKSYTREGELVTTGLQLLVYSREQEKFYQKIVTKDDIRTTVFDLEDIENVFRACFDGVTGYFLEIVNVKTYTKNPPLHSRDVIELRFRCKEVIKTYNWTFVLEDKKTTDLEEIEKIFQRYHDPVYNMMHSWIQTQIELDSSKPAENDDELYTNSVQERAVNEPVVVEDDNSSTVVAESDSWKELYSNFISYLDKIKTDVQRWCHDSRKERLMLPYINKQDVKEKPKSLPKKTKKLEDSVESESYDEDSDSRSYPDSESSESSEEETSAKKKTVAKKKSNTPKKPEKTVTKKKSPEISEAKVKPTKKPAPKPKPVNNKPKVTFVAKKKKSDSESDTDSSVDYDNSASDEEVRSDSPENSDSDELQSNGKPFTYGKFMDKAKKRIRSEEPNWSETKIQTKALGEWENYVKLLNSMLLSKSK